MRVSRMFIIIFALLAIGAFFLPYFTSSGSLNEFGKAFGNEIIDETVNVTGTEMTKPSLFTYCKIFFSDNDVLRDTFRGLMICLVPFNTFLILLFGLTGVAVPALIFSIFLGGSEFIVYKDFELRGVIPSSNIDFGIAFYILWGCAILLFIVSICGIVEKHNYKERLRQRRYRY